MAFWSKLFGGDPGFERVDYYDEGLALLREGNHHEALTSFRLALKDSPSDPVVLQQIAICYTHIGMTDEAAKTYRHVLQKQPSASGAHYGLAFLLVRAGNSREAVPHLKAFLAHPPEGPDAREHIAHARSTLFAVTGEGSAEPIPPGGSTPPHGSAPPRGPGEPGVGAPE